jgi:serine/threonine protein kinase
MVTPPSLEPVSDLELRAAEQIGPYCIQGVLGRGGWGRVYLAHANGGEVVALKVLNADLMGDQFSRKRFMREGAVLTKLDHPNVIKFVGRGVDDERMLAYLAFEYVPGVDLRVLLSRVPQGLGVEETVFVVQRCARALQAVHAAGILHRDLKPSNVLVTAQGEVKLIDFGIALSRDASARLTSAGEVLGTMSYLDPCLLEPDAVWSTGSDLYSLGCIAFRLLANRPYQWESGSLRGAFEAEGDAAWEEIGRTAPASLVRVVLSLLQRDPDLRPSAGDVVAALEDLGLEHTTSRIALEWSEGRIGARFASPFALETESGGDGTTSGSAGADNDTVSVTGAGAVSLLRESTENAIQGLSVGPYQVRGELARGSMGVVLLARHVALGRDFAIKVMTEPSTDRISSERFQREVDSLSRLQHPGIVRIHDSGVTATGSPYFVMDLVDGHTLRRAVRDGLSPEETVDLIEEVCLALGHAHRQGLVHRDVKPENVMVQGGHAVLTDFGLAKVLGSSSQSLTGSGEILGTVNYMAPEQAAGRPITPATDVFAVGVMLYEVYAGAPPFQSESMAVVLGRLVRGDSAPPLGADAPSAIRAVCARALACDPEQRFSDGLALYRALAGARRQREDSSTAPPRVLVVLALLAVLLAAVGVSFLLGVSSVSAWQPGGETQLPAAGDETAIGKPGDGGPSADAPDASKTKPAPTPSASASSLSPLGEVPRLTSQQLTFGTWVTAELNDKLRPAVIVGDSGDGGYELVFADGNSARQAPQAGFLPDVFVAGAECHGSRARRSAASGTIVKRRGLAVLVDFGDEQSWLPLNYVWIAPKQRVPLPLPPVGEARLLFADYSTWKVSYAAVELDRRDGRSRVIYLDGGDIEWRTSSQLKPLPEASSQVEFNPLGSKQRVKAQVVDRKAGMIRLRLKSGQEHWVALALIRMPP